MMDCNVVKDLIPLYLDGCCSAESEQIVKEHIENCDSCKTLVEDMKASSDIVPMPEVPITLSRVNDWKASVMQSVLLFLSFAVITVGVALEARTPSGRMNGFWAANLVIPATGFMLSLTNWYFVKFYKSRKLFSKYSFVITLCITLCAYIWAGVHYKWNVLELFAECNIMVFFDFMHGILVLKGIGILLTVIFCVLSKTLSNRYAEMLGKE